MTTFTDPFAKIADRYARHRPQYPVELFTFLAGTTADHSAAWDCATGNGQAAIALVRHFDTVWATDASAEQLARAEAHPRIHYRLAPAEESGLPDHSVSLVTVAQAVHWFSLEAFYREVRRVLKPGGIIAIWGYVVFNTGQPEIDEIINRLNYTTLKPYFDPRVLPLWDNYVDLPFPFDRIETPGWSIDVRWSLEELIGLISSWSGLKNYQTATGTDPLPEIGYKLRQVWGEGERDLSARLATLVGRV